MAVERTAIDQDTKLFKPLGDDLYIKICEWQGEPRVDIRAWLTKCGKTSPSKTRGLSMTVATYRQLENIVPTISKELTELIYREAGYTKFVYHINADIKVSLEWPYIGVSIRKWFKTAEGKVCPGKGIFIKPHIWHAFCQLHPQINECITQESTPGDLTIDTERKCELHSELQNV